MIGWWEKKNLKSLENYTNVFCNTSTKTKLHCMIPTYQFILHLSLISFTKQARWKEKQSTKEIECTLIEVLVKSIIKLVSGNLVKMYESKEWI